MYKIIIKSYITIKQFFNGEFQTYCKGDVKLMSSVFAKYVVICTSSENILVKKAQDEIGNCSKTPYGE